MDLVQEMLFGEFPRSVGVTTPDRSGELTQYFVHSSDEMESIANEVDGQRNLYSSLCSFSPVRNDNGGVKGTSVLVDKLSYDFDSSAKGESSRWNHPEIPDDAGDRWVSRRMFVDTDVREAVLGDVCDDVRRLAQCCKDSEIPVLGVFSGFGIHVHQLVEETRENVKEKLSTTCEKYISDLSLSTVDRQASGQTVRLMRYPNIDRVVHGSELFNTGIRMIPMSVDDLCGVSPQWLISNCQERRRVSRPSVSRPSLEIHEDYRNDGSSDRSESLGMRSMPDEQVDDDFLSFLVRDIVKLPCVSERALGSNPPNAIRVKLAVHFLMAGFSVDDITDVIEQLNWDNFDWETTRYQVEKLKESGKGDWSCSTMQSKGFCVKGESCEKCPTEGYRGGNLA